MAIPFELTAWGFCSFFSLSPRSGGWSNRRHRGRVALATLAALLSVQCLYHNAILLFAICLGAAAVGLRRRQPKCVILVLTIGAVAGISLLPYLPIIRRVGAWNFQFKAPISFPFLWGKLSETLASPIGAAVWAWVTLICVSPVGAGLWALCRRSDGQAAESRDRLLFLWVTLLVGPWATRYSCAS